VKAESGLSLFLPRPEKILELAKNTARILPTVFPFFLLGFCRGIGCRSWLWGSRWLCSRADIRCSLASAHAPGISLRTGRTCLYSLSIASFIKGEPFLHGHGVGIPGFRAPPVFAVFPGLCALPSVPATVSPVIASFFYSIVPPILSSIISVGPIPSARPVRSVGSVRSVESLRPASPVVTATAPIPPVKATLWKRYLLACA